MRFTDLNFAGFAEGLRFSVFMSWTFAAPLS